MNPNKLTHELFEKNLITLPQHEQVMAHRSAALFSLRREILFFFLVSVLMFCSGTGIIIYKNIDTIGHLVILGILLILIVTCFYFCFKQFSGYSNKKVITEKPVYDYLLLAANLLTAVFIAYLNQQYTVFGLHDDVATLLPTFLFFFSAYYFDHRGLLTMGIAGLCTFIGFSASPTGILHNHYFNDSTLAYYAVALAGGFTLFSLYSEKEDLKKHFNPTYENFAFHIASVASVVILFVDFWIPGLLILIATLFYFQRICSRRLNLQMLVFLQLYAFVGTTILLSKLIAIINLNVIIYLTPFYFLFCILFFVKNIRQFKTRIRNESL